MAQREGNYKDTRYVVVSQYGDDSWIVRLMRPDETTTNEVLMPLDALPAATPEGSDDEFAKATTDDQALRGYVCPECPWQPIARPDVPVDAVQMQVSQHGAIHGLAVALREAADALPAVTTPLMVTDITQDQANELQDILRTLTNSGTALITSARDLVKRYEALLKQSASVVQTAPVEAKTTTYLLQNPRDPEWFDEQIEWFSHGPEKVDRAEVVKCLKAGKQFAALPAPAVSAPAPTPAELLPDPWDDGKLRFKAAVPAPADAKEKP